MPPLGETGRDPRKGTTPGRDPAIGTAHATMQSLLDHRMSPSPENYLVWFSYHAGTHPELHDALDARLAAQGRLEQADLNEMHARYCAGEPQAQAIGQVSRQLEVALNDAAGMLGTAHDNASSYGTRLEGLTDTLEAAFPSLNEPLRRILADTQALCHSSRTLAQRLAERAREAEALRDALQEARRAAATDALTGLPNRRAFEERLTEALARATTEQTPLCLLMFDIDHFKSVNDRHGHPAGDAVLRGVADTLREWARPHDRLARVGGEEFAAILPATCREAAAGLADSLRRAVANEGFLVGAEGQRLSVTVSLGVAQLQPEETGDGLLSRADAALYDAKRQGRDRVVLDMPPAPDAPEPDEPGEARPLSWR
ncbi:GGDEF domain-containing protein [Roseococcus suduntuyensis]|uniref:diguanylate cyclase n=1 Tax=Roseococcus suduntuyensis TaxID=455361 RepID=A0A840AEG3_9PROT|nr:GGDEF domain-containing protein [Roseococcus suduntuyensis]MBB3900019.1 diguanylate cyclase [Roseococcus suduntuyensis]